MAATIYVSKYSNIKAIAAIAQSGNAAQWLSRADIGAPIYRLLVNEIERRKLTLHRNVFQKPIAQDDKNRDEILQEIEQVMLRNVAVATDNTVLFRYGEPIGCTSVTNTLKVVKVDEMTQAATTKAE